MSVPVALLSILLSTSFILCVTLTLAWLHFGRQRYILSWALAFGCSVLHWTLNLAGVIFLPGNRTVVAVATLFPLVTASLTAIGCRQRAMLPEYFGRFIAAGSCMAVAILAAFATGIHVGMRAALPSFYGATMLIMGFLALRRMPEQRTKSGTRGEGLRAPEVAFMAGLAAVALFQIGLGIVALVAVGAAGNPGGIALVRTILGMGLPPMYIAFAAAAIFLVASDLAEQFRKLVTRDSLTGILNRRGVEEAAAMAIANARRHDRDISVVLADIDSFKSLNDRLGHVAGDKALIAFTEYVQASIRHGDIFGRLGGDEFCLILLDTRASDAAHVVERARADVERLGEVEMPGCGLTASFGIAGLRPGDLFLAALIGRADRALYQSKLLGRNRISIARGDEESLTEWRLIKGA